MAINDVSLTAGMRSNLLSLQGTVDLLNRTQNRLSTGKKVNSAIDNPVSFFASQALTSRASIIDSLKDAMGQAVQTITTADKGIKAITAMIEQAKGIAQSALSAAPGVAPDDQTISAATIAGLTAGSTEVFATVSIGGLDGAADDSTIILGAGTDNEVTFTEGVDWDNADSAADAAAALMAAINAVVDGAYTAELSDDGESVIISLAGANVATGDVSGTAVVTVAEAQEHEDAVAASTVTVDGTVYTAGNQFQIGADDDETAANLADAIEGQDGVAAAIVANGAITVSFEAGPSEELVSLQGQYNTLLTQLTALAGDSGYKGKNLLAGDTLAVKFEGTTLSVDGFNASAGGLGITDATWTVGGGIDADIDFLDEALVTLRQESSKMSGNLSIITVRQEFSTNMINTLTEGADKLTLADTNEEGANMLMLQTRQSLSTTALSLSAQAAQSVLRLFG
jgi:flagellin-like hook-associated protein FlgL